VLAPVPQTVSIITDLDNLKSTKYAINQTVQTNTRTVLNHKASTAQIFGRPEAAIEADDTYSALTSANPVNTWIWQMAQVSLDQTTSNTCFVQVQIDYDIVFFNRKALALS